MGDDSDDSTDASTARRLAEAEAALAQARAEAAEIAARLVEAEARAAVLAEREARWRALLDQALNSRRYRLGSALARPIDRRRVRRTPRSPMPFIVGAGRSGTTLLRLMLDSHPDLAIPAETGWVPAAAALPPGRDLAARLVSLVTGHPTFADSGVDPEAYASAVRRLRPPSLADGVRAFYRLYADGQGKPRAGDKSPAHTLAADRIAALLPEARIVHVIRDGRDVALSVRPLWFAAGPEVADLARDWRRTVETCRQLGARCAHYAEVRYERLLADPEGELRRLAAALELPWDPAMLRYHERARARLDEVRTWLRPDGSVLITKDERLRNHRLTSSPPDLSRVGRWRTEMSADERAAFSREAGGLLAELGYPN